MDDETIDNLFFEIEVRMMLLEEMCADIRRKADSLIKDIDAIKEKYSVTEDEDYWTSD